MSKQFINNQYKIIRPKTSTIQYNIIKVKRCHYAIRDIEHSYGTLLIGMFEAAIS